MYLPELNPILSFANYQQAAGGRLHHQRRRLAVGHAAAASRARGRATTCASIGVINSRGLGIAPTRPEYERGNAYPGPNYLTRARALGIPEAFDCKPTGGEVKEPRTASRPASWRRCSLFDGRLFPRLERGEAPLRPPPPGTLGSQPANP